MIPLGDDVPTVRTPVATYLIIAACFLVWIFYQGAGFNAVRLATTVCNTGMVPGELTHLAPIGQSVPLGPGMACAVDNDPINIFTPFISMFLHGSWLHILGNMLFLFVFGRAVEDSMGSVRYAFFYIICGLVAAATHIALNANSPVPTVGASGAISGVMGAYLVMYPTARVKMWFFLFIIRVPAWLVLIWWFLEQALTGLQQLNQINPNAANGVAVWAHVGGFVCGAILSRFFVNPSHVRTRMDRVRLRTI
jgi:membrane associated rhomboid family serine protease